MLDLEAPRGVESATLPVRPRTPERNDVIHATLEVPLLDAASPNILRSLAARLGAPFAIPPSTTMQLERRFQTNSSG